jgi:SAM-dependent methyltransferase
MEPFSWQARSGQSAEMLESSRRRRFLPEWRPVLMHYFGLAPGMTVLEVACGPGTLAPYLAAGVAPGHVTAIDRDAGMIARAEARGDVGVTYRVADAMDLPFPDAHFDAAVSYTGIGVMPDPRRAISEMVRVVRPGGTVAVAEAVTGLRGIAFAGRDTLPGPEPYPGATRYRELRARMERALDSARRPSGVGSSEWPPEALWALMGDLGLEGLRLNAWGYVDAVDDARERNRAERVVTRRRAEREQWEALSRDPVWNGVFSAAEWAEWWALWDARSEWSRREPTYEWEAGLSLVMAGRRSR